jgi:hypothetical protein
MALKPWDTRFWPEGVPREITGYEKPVFSLLDDAATTYPDNTFTIFNGRFKSYARVKETADRLAHFLAGQGIRKGDRVAVFLPNLPHFPEIFLRCPKSGGHLCHLQPALYRLQNCNISSRTPAPKSSSVWIILSSTPRWWSHAGYGRGAGGHLRGQVVSATGYGIHRRVAGKDSQG